MFTWGFFFLQTPQPLFLFYKYFFTARFLVHLIVFVNNNNTGLHTIADMGNGRTRKVKALSTFPQLKRDIKWVECWRTRLQREGDWLIGCLSTHSHMYEAHQISPLSTPASWEKHNLHTDLRTWCGTYSRVEDLHVERAVWGKILHGPGPKNGLMVLWQRKTERKRSTWTEVYH